MPDTISLYSWIFSSCCHVLLLSALFFQYEASLLPPEEELPVIENVIQEEQTAPPASVTANPVPALSVVVPDRQADSHTALPAPELPDLNDNQLFDAALLKPIHRNQQADMQDEDGKASQKVTLPTLNIDSDQILLEKLKHAAGQEDFHAHSNDLQNFTWAVNIIITSYYHKHWRKRFADHITNHEISLLISVKDSAIVDSTIIKGSGSKAFDDVLMIWMHNTRVNGPPVPDGQYPIILKMR